MLTPGSEPYGGGRSLVTGAAGFIGSTLVDRLLAEGRTVVGVDCLTSAYDPLVKLRNLEQAFGNPRFLFSDSDLVDAELASLFVGVDSLYHLAGQPGVQTSWGAGFAQHVENNFVATQRLLEEALEACVARVVLASSSSVYGTVDGATTEDDPVRPLSPYGVTKLAAENLAAAYVERGLDVVSLRFFTVYGPRQRPDMAIYRMIEAALGGPPFPLRGEGNQRRSFTYVSDVVDAIARVGVTPNLAGKTLNVGSMVTTALVDVLEEVERAVGRPVPVERHKRMPGDPDLTHAAVDRLRAAVGWEPATVLVDGLFAQVAHHRAFRTVGVSSGSVSS